MLEQTETTVPIIRGPGEGRVVGVLRGQSTFKVESAQTGGAYAILEQIVPPGHGPPLHVHRHETEVFHILEGEFELRVGPDTLRVGPGAVAVCPREIPHTFKNVGTEPGKLMLTVIPGHFAEYFIEVDELPDPTPDQVRDLCARYGVDILE